MLKQLVLDLLQEKKQAQLDAVALTWDALIAQVQDLPEDTSSEVDALRAQVESLQVQLQDAQTKLAQVDALAKSIDATIPDQA